MAKSGHKPKCSRCLVQDVNLISSTDLLISGVNNQSMRWRHACSWLNSNFHESLIVVIKLPRRCRPDIHFNDVTLTFYISSDRLQLNKVVPFLHVMSTQWAWCQIWSGMCDSQAHRYFSHAAVQYCMIIWWQMGSSVVDDGQKTMSFKFEAMDIFNPLAPVNLLSKSVTHVMVGFFSRNGWLLLRHWPGALLLAWSCLNTCEHLTWKMKGGSQVGDRWDAYTWLRQTDRMAYLWWIDVEEITVQNNLPSLQPWLGWLHQQVDYFDAWGKWHMRAAPTIAINNAACMPALRRGHTSRRTWSCGVTCIHSSKQMKTCSLVNQA